MISYIANLILPFLIFSIVLYGILKRKDMYDPFLKGVADGFRIVAEVAPTLIALFFAIQIFRSSGALDLLVRFLAPAASFLQIPTEVLPVIFAKLFSSSAATGFLLDIFKTSGPDSAAGFLSSVILSSTETCFYIMSVYYSSVHIRKTRHTLRGALLATFAGIAASVILCRVFYS
ncbi:MAG TPA: spore maturation protein [Candidatus Anaerostipes avistercoris]|uniref:Spore maturation protein n=1 Tax=Candidatus Anaerostipes avistercoris TaxID=2838462 RepID=A0A9D2PJ23_9FIRM|nr:spore maturation protein [Candidatus Anaerostipes avistercoris]